MAHTVTSKTFAQASTPSNRIVFTFNGAAGTENVLDSELQYTFGPNNASATPSPTRVQISPALIEKVIVSSGTLSVVSNVLGTYEFVQGVPYDFSESGGLPIALNSAVGNALTFTLAGTATTAQIVLRGYQIAPRN